MGVAMEVGLEEPCPSLGNREEGKAGCVPKLHLLTGILGFLCVPASPPPTDSSGLRREEEPCWGTVFLVPCASPQLL